MTQKKQSKFRSIYDPYHQKLNTKKGKKMTVPGQVRSIKQMIERHKNGLPMEMDNSMEYTGEELLPEVKDLIDLENMNKKLGNLEDKISKKEQIKKQKENEIKAEKEKQKIIEDYEKQINEKGNPKQD